jgi:hypothetical protein
MVTLTLEGNPRAATHWSTRAMAARCGLSQSTVSRVWRAFGLQPHRTPTFPDITRQFVLFPLREPSVSGKSLPKSSRPALNEVLRTAGVAGGARAGSRSSTRLSTPRSRR